MEPLISQIAQAIREFDTKDNTGQVGKALKEMAFSGLSREGFFKVCPYIPELEIQKGRDLFESFLYTGTDQLIPNDYLAGVCEELKALGTDVISRKTETGFEIETAVNTDEEPFRLFINAFSKKLKETRIRIAYIHTPLAYELRTVEDLPEAILTEFRNKLKACIKAESKTNKKVPGKAHKEKKAPEESWIQPSLFDF